MGRYDDISDAKLRYEVQRFARILQRMEAKGEVLDRTADILTLLGELRRMVFAWEVRSTFQGDAPGEGVGPAVDLAADPAVDEEAGPESDSERIVREALEQQTDFVAGLGPESGPASGPDAAPPPPEDGTDGGEEDDDPE